MSDKTKLEQVKDLLNKLENKKFGLYFFTMDTKGNPTAGIANIYEHVKLLTELGYNAHILHEKNDYQLRGDAEVSGLADWLGEEYANLSHISIESQTLNIGPEDFIIIPEIFSNIMDQVKNFPCKKIVLSQSYDYLLELLPIGRRWSDYGFNDVITTSDTQAKYIKSLFPSVKTSVVPVSIPKYFKPSEKPKIPVVSILTRNQGEAAKIAKMFYLQNPLFKWVTFKELRGLSREQFALELGKSCLAVWVDDSAGFGTFPLEAMQCDTPVIGKIPNMLPEWMVNPKTETSTESIKNNGIWTNTHLAIPELISTFLTHWLEDTLPVEILKEMEATKNTYTVERQKEAIEKVYGALIADRKLEVEKLITTITENEVTY